MKQIKNTWILIIGSLLAATFIFISCSKKDTAPPVVPKPTITSITPTTAYSGDTVTITGTNLTGATAVGFGGTPAAAYTVVNATTIKAKLGTGAAGAVTVVAPGGTASFTSFTFNTGLAPVDGYSSSNDIESASLIGHWPFDGNSTEAIHSKNPILSGGTATYVTGRIGQAVHLEAGWFTYDSTATSAGSTTNPYESNDTLQNGFTLSVWAQVPDTSLLTNLFQLSTPNIPNWPILGISYRKHGDNSFDFDAGLANVDGTGPHVSYAAAFKEPAFLDTLTWTHIVMTYDGTSKSLKYYANGALVNTINLVTLGGGPFPDPTASLLMITPNYATIGTYEGTIVNGSTSTITTPGDAGNAIPGFMSTGITGNIDDIRFYNKTLTDKQVSDLFVLGNQGR